MGQIPAIYDVVCVAMPGALTSNPAGRVCVQSYGAASESLASALAARCQECATVSGIAFVVEPHESDECPGRSKPQYHKGDWTDGRCRCFQCD